MEIEDIKALGVEDEELAQKIVGAVAESESGLKSNQAKLLSEKKKLAESLEAFSVIDIDEYESMKKQLEEIDEKNMLDKNEFEKLNAQRDERLNKINSEWNEKYDGLFGRFKSKSISDDIKTAAIEHDGNPLLPAYLKSFVDFREVDGEYMTVILENDGKTIKLDDNTGNPITVSDFVAGLKSQALKDNKYLAGLFNSSGLSGGGASQSTGRAGAKQMTRQAFEAASPGEQREFIRKGGIVV